MKYPFILMFASLVLSTLLFAWILRAVVVEAQIMLSHVQRPKVGRRRRSCN